MTGITCALAGSGGGVVYAGSASMTIGYQSFDITDGGTRFVGYNSGYTPTIGAMSNRVFGGTADITSLYYTDFDVYYSGVFSQRVQALILELDEDIGNKDWTSIITNATSFLRTSGSYSGGSYSRWQWSFVTTNPIGTSGTALITWG
jgi:hypothetical protein